MIISLSTRIRCYVNVRFSSSYIFFPINLGAYLYLFSRFCLLETVNTLVPWLFLNEFVLHTDFVRVPFLI